MTENEKIRYSRMISLPEIGYEGIEKLKASHILIIGCGALGSICAMYLAGAGIGKLTIADFDLIDISNLQRQLFFETSQSGQPKADILSARIKALNPGCSVDVVKKLVTISSAGELLRGVDFAIDATDNPASKNMTDSACNQNGVPYCIGGVNGFTGQVMSWQPGCVSYSDVFNPAEACSGISPCSFKGVMGPAAGIVACIQASEAIKHLTGCGKMLLDKIFTIDLLSMQSSILPVD